MKPTMVLTTTKQLNALSNPKRFSILKALVHDQLTASELAERLDVKVHQLYYHLKELEKLGLIEVVETVQVRNLLEKSYRATARHFSLARDLIPQSSQGNAMIVQSIDGIFQTTLDEIALLLEQQAINQADGSLWFMHRGLRVPTARRQEFKRRLLELLQDFEQENTTQNVQDVNFTMTFVGYASEPDA